MKLTPLIQLLRVLETSVSPATGRVAVGYSGGRDSTVLLALCCRLWPGRVTALYVDHGWRPERERQAERALVGRVCRQLPCPVIYFEPAPQAADSANGLEAGARDHRYACFERYHADHPQEPILLAHHAQDQAETILMRLLQGRSWQGLAGIPQERGPFLRPFLDVWPDAFNDIMRDLTLEVSQDSTNGDTSLKRNAVRNQIMPLLEKTFPGASRSLVRFGEVWSDRHPATTIDARWTQSAMRAVIDRTTWDSWSTLEKGNQLQALATRWRPGRRPRRYIDSLLGGGESGGLRLGLEKSRVVWESVVKVPGLQYFRDTAEGQPVNLGNGEMSWSTDSGDFPLDWGSGMEHLPVYVASHDAVAVRRWGAVFRDDVAPDCRNLLKTAVYWLVGSEVRGVFDPEGGSWLWRPSPRPGAARLWVTLRRSAYER